MKKAKTSARTSNRERALTLADAFPAQVFDQDGSRTTHGRLLGLANECVVVTVHRPEIPDPVGLGPTIRRLGSDNRLEEVAWLQNWRHAPGDVAPPSSPTAHRTAAVSLGS